MVPLEEGVGFIAQDPREPTQPVPSVRCWEGKGRTCPITRLRGSLIHPRLLAADPAPGAVLITEVLHRHDLALR